MEKRTSPRSVLRPYYLLVFVAAALVSDTLGVHPLVTLLLCALALLPLSYYLGLATEALASKAGVALGAFLTSTVGNAAEVIIGITAIRAGLVSVAKASIAGSIIGNSLLLLGLSFLIGGWRREKQTFSPTVAGVYAALLLLSAISLLVPAIFHYGVRKVYQSPVELSAEIAVVLVVMYLITLLFIFKTHPHLYQGAEIAAVGWSPATAAAVLLAAVVCLTLVSDALVETFEHLISVLKISQTFLGVVVVAILGNIGEQYNAVRAAYKDRMDLCISIGLGGCVQTTLFVAPTLLFVSLLVGHPLNFVFAPLEVLGVVISVAAVGIVCIDGVSYWVEGALLLAVYAILAFAFFAHP